MENKNKSNVGFIVLIVILLLVICGLVGYILYDKASDDIKSQNGKKIETEKEEKDASKYQDELASLSENIFQYDKENLNLDEFDDQDFIYVLASISGKSITEVTGTELKQIAKDNFGIDDLKLVDIRCGMNHPSDETNIMLIFNTENDKYEYNENHPGHGGGGSGASVYFADGKVSVDGDYYKYSSNIYFYRTCNGDTCGPIENLNVYAIYNDLEQDTNKIMDATSNENYCQQVDFGYECNYDKIYDAIKDRLHSVTFYYKLVNNKPVFDRYEFK